MRVFVTGASGWIGSAVTRDLIAAGHEVLGLARSDASAKIVAEAGGEVQRGAIDDLDVLQRAAAACEGVIHCAFIHDFVDFAASCAKDEAAIVALGKALEGSNRPLIAAAGTLGLAHGHIGKEDDEATTIMPRRSEQAALALKSRGVRAMAMRLSPSVHGTGDHGFIAMLIKTAREQGFVTVVGDGRNRWPAVHRFDAARLFLLALEKGAAGARFHAAADEGIAFREIAEAIGRGLKLPVVSKTAEEAAATMGFMGHVIAMDGPVSSALTRERLGWRPAGPGLIEDIDKGHYFSAP